MGKHFKEEQERYLELTHGYNIVLALVYVMLKIKQGVTKEKWFWAYYFLTGGIHFFGCQGWGTFLEDAYHLSQ